MFTEALPGNAKENLAILGRSSVLKKAYLAGGTGVALQLAHRISHDFDFFIPQEFYPKRFVSSLIKYGEFKEEQASKGTVLGEFRGTKFSLFFYRYPLLYPLKKFLGLKIADLRDIAAMKIEAIATRGSKRDFIDIYFMCKEGMTLGEMLRFYDRKYGNLAPNLVHIKKSLVYFVDAEPDEMPEVLKPCSWPDVKRFFEREIVRLVGVR